MKINMEALKTLELKLTEYTKANGTIAEHESANANIGCAGRSASCNGICKHMCEDSCEVTCQSFCMSACRGPQ